MFLENGVRVPLGTPHKKSPLLKTAAGGSPVDIPRGWNPQANQQPTGLLVALPLMRQSRLVRVPLGTPPNKKSADAKHQRIFWWGAQWDSNPRSPDPQSGALTDYAMGTTSMRPKGLEPPAHCLEGSCSIHLSYGRTLLSHWVPLWRQPCVGTRCEKYNTIRLRLCQEKIEISLIFFLRRSENSEGTSAYSSHIPAAPSANPSAAPKTTSRTWWTPVRTRPAQISAVMPTIAQPAAG